MLDLSDRNLLTVSPNRFFACPSVSTRGKSHYGRLPFAKNFWEFRSEISMRLKHIPLSVVRANHSDITHQYVNNLDSETMV